MANNPSGNRKFGDIGPSKFPGERLGLPEVGTRSIGRVGRRIGAIAIDWVIAVLVTMLISAKDYLTLTSASGGPLGILAVFVVLQVLAIMTIGGSVGHRLCGLHIVTIQGKHPGIWKPILRSILLALVFPAIVWDSDQRGFHDKVSGTMLLRA